MTIDETRQMAIEFERRINALDPTTESINKLDTDTIFSFLNQYQTQYVLTVYMSMDLIDGESRLSRKMNDLVKTLITHAIISDRVNDERITDLMSDCFILPDNYYMYIRSNSVVTGTYKNISDFATVGNVFMKQDQVKEVLQSYYNLNGIIRNPIAVLTSLYSGGNQTYLQIIHDVYTKIFNVELVYYRQPSRFNIIDGIACELPYECFDDLVDGAVKLYMSYKYPDTNNPKRPKKDESE